MGRVREGGGGGGLPVLRQACLSANCSRWQLARDKQCDIAPRCTASGSNHIKTAQKANARLQAKPREPPRISTWQQTSELVAGRMAALRLSLLRKADRRLASAGAGAEAMGRG
jgi:hypothetical protein